MSDPGVRLQLYLGEKTLRPAPFDVVDGLVSLEVRSNVRTRDAFQMTFAVGRTRNQWDYPLLGQDLLEPPNRIAIVVVIQGLPEVLINGIITQHQLLPSNEPGQSRLQITGEDIGLLLDLVDHRATHPELSDSDIVRKILRDYADFKPQITRTTERPSKTKRVTTQRETDRSFIEKLAQRNSFVFFSEPLSVGRNLAYWGPKDRKDVSIQAALNMNMDWMTNVTQLSFNYDALRPVKPKLTIIDPRTKRAVPIPQPRVGPRQLSSRPAQPLRERVLPNTTGLTRQEATRRAQAAVDDGAEAVTANGEVDVVHYGQVLRARRRVDVRGAGHLYDGAYYVKQVTHRIRRGEYTQSFSLTREGRKAKKGKVERPS